MPRSRLAIVLVALGLVAMLAPTASAGPPEVVDEFEASFGPDPFVPFCGFDLLIETDVSVRHVHHDIGRDRVIHQTWVDGVDRVYRADDPSRMVSGSFRNSDIETTDDHDAGGILRIHGVLWHLQAPGAGTVFHESGQLTLDFSLLPEDPFVSFTGRSDWGSESFDALCAALS